MDLKRLAESAFWPECRGAQIVCVDGCFQEFLSDVSALPPSILLRQEDDAIVFYLSPGTKISTPVQVVLLFTGSVPSSTQMRLLLDRGAHLDLIRTVAGEGVGEDGLDMILSEEACLNIAEQFSPKESLHRFCNLRAFLQRKACLNSFFGSKGALSLHRDWQVMLNEEGASAELRELDDLDNQGTVHTRVRVRHQAPSCRSRQYFKKVLRGQSQSICEGSIYIEPEAHFSDASQLCQNLLLDSAARALVKPFLDILADDVSVKHGATFCQIDAEELFYCRSRGMDEVEAKELWRQGFCRELLDAIDFPVVRKRAYETVA